VTFVEVATKLAGQTALLLGWRPNDFWNATPAELASILSAVSNAGDAANIEKLTELMEQFPDG
jgi:hypothetical protein